MPWNHHNVDHFMTRNLQCAFDNEKRSNFRKSFSEPSGVRSIHFPFGGSRLSSTSSISEASEDVRILRSQENSINLDTQSHPGQKYSAFMATSERDYGMPSLNHISHPFPDARLIENSSLRFNSSQLSRPFTYHSWSNQSRTYPYFDDKKRHKNYSTIAGIDSLRENTKSQRKLDSDDFQTNFFPAKLAVFNGNNYSPCLTSDKNLQPATNQESENRKKLHVIRRQSQDAEDDMNAESLESNCASFLSRPADCSNFRNGK